MHHRLLPWVCVVLFVPCLPTPSEAGEPSGALAGFALERTWSDQSARFKILAELAFADSQEVRLRKSDGRTVTVPLEKLSQADQSFIQGFLSAEKALGAIREDRGDDADNPFAGGEAGPSSGRMPESGSASDALPNLAEGAASLEQRRTILKGFRPMSITSTKAFWSAEPPVSFPDVEFEDVVLETELRKPFFAAMRVMAAGKSGTIVLNSYQQGKGSKENFANFVIASAASVDASQVFEFDQPWKLMALSPDASRIAAVRVEGFDKGNDVAIFRIVGGQLVPEFHFTAGGGSWDELHWIGFLPGNRLATISQKHNLTFWDLANKVGPKAIRRGTTGGAMSAELSAAGDLMAFPYETSIAVIETAAGKVVGCITRDEAANSIALSPDGKTIAAFHPFNVALYSTTDGKEIRNIAVAENAPQTSIRWVGKHLMVGQVLYDVERGVPMWTYEGDPKFQSTLANYIITGFGGENNSTVTVFRLPHEEALQTAKDLNPDQVYALVPGDSVSVHYQLGAAPANVQQEIRKAVEAKLAATGWKLTSNGQNKVEVKLEQGEQKEAEYYTRRGFGPSFAPPGFGPRPSGPADKVQYRPWTHSLVIYVGGNDVYTSQYVRGAPQNLQTKDGESTQAAVNRICQPSPDYFKNLALPPHLLKKEFQGGLGKSKITRTGIQ